MPNDAVPMHKIEPIVTPDAFELGVHRMRVPGGWLYWLHAAPGFPISTFVPDLPPLVEIQGAATPLATEHLLRDNAAAA